jgi:Cysteine-rich secretory protein family
MRSNRLKRNLAPMFLGLVLCSGVLMAQGLAPAQFDVAGEAQLVGLINQARAQQGLPPLTEDDRLTAAARKHTELMVQHAALSHQFPGEPDPQTRMTNEGVPSDAEGENVDLNQSISGAHDALMHSPPHRASIMNPDYNAVGVGVIRSGDNVWVTEDFAHRLPQLSEPQAEAAVQTAIANYERARGAGAVQHKPLTELRRIACDMALNDKLDLQPAARLPGVRDVFAWTAGDPAKLPKGIDRVLSGPMSGGYSLGACFAPSVSHPGGIYWLVLVAY